MKNYVLLAVLLLAGCGGGSGGGSDGAFYGGIWKVDIKVVKNSCNQSGVRDINDTFTVNQDDTRVVVESPNGTIFEGQPNSDGFLVFNSKVEAGGCSKDSDFIESIELSFFEAQGNRALVGISNENRCERSLVTCKVEWIGTAEKTK